MPSSAFSKMDEKKLERFEYLSLIVIDKSCLLVIPIPMGGIGKILN